MAVAQYLKICAEKKDYYLDLNSLTFSDAAYFFLNKRYSLGHLSGDVVNHPLPSGVNGRTD